MSPEELARTRLKPRRMGIDSHSQPVVFLRADCHVCRSEGLEAQTQVTVTIGDKSVVATLNIVYSDILDPGEVGLSEAAWRRLEIDDGELAVLSHTPALDSMSHVRSKLYGHRLSRQAMHEIITDVVAGHYGDIHLAALLTACSGNRLDLSEITWLTESMVGAGRRIDWGREQVMDKHCLGGLPGNRTTPIVVSIAAACGLLIPKTSSRAITSPAGTADTMETMTRVTLGLEDMRRVVEKENGCLVWGGSVSLSPADDILIRVERALDIDSEGQMVASVLSKKIAAGSTHVLIDIPVGPTAKVRGRQAAEHLAHILKETGKALGIQVRTVQSDGTQPIGFGIGPALEAVDVLAVLRHESGAPADLRERALMVAGELLEIGGKAAHGKGQKLARETLTSGRAWQKFLAICEAQGGFHEPVIAGHTRVITAQRNGIVTHINNRVISRLAKLAGAPGAPGAGVRIAVHLGDRVESGQPLFELFADSPGELAYALEFHEAHPDMIRVEEESA